MFINLSFLYVIFIVYYFVMEFNYFKDIGKYVYENKFMYVILQYKGLKEVFDSGFE